ncbi:MAG: hypothetical protein ACFCBW_23335 [Candidatus Competibacterales bacterium]
MIRLVILVVLCLLVFSVGVQWVMAHQQPVSLHLGAEGLMLSVGALTIIAFVGGIVVTLLGVLLGLVWPLRHRLYLLQGEVEERDQLIAEQRQWMEARFQRP